MCVRSPIKTRISLRRIEKYFPQFYSQMYRVFFLCQVSWFSGLPSCLSSVDYLQSFKIVLRLRNLGLFMVLVLSVLHFIRTCLFGFVSFGVPELQGATNTRKIFYSLLVLGKISQSKAISKKQIPH